MYLAARDLEGGNSGWQAMGTWQVPFTASGTIAVVSLSPAHGTAASGTAQTLTATLTDSHGAGVFGVVNVLVKNFIDGRSSTACRCWCTRAPSGFACGRDWRRRNRP
ncbi:hypothetical protein SBA4_3540012 [Candidatus Sulfopaludibacter sp. SbA4]|nr:hypothetical protein SBA4_3540012 [Candidatus Sulfopaludibacter sp. SbA4]